MGAAKTTWSEIDQSTRVPSFPGAYGGIVIPAMKGPVDEPYLITSDAQLLKIFTPSGTVKVGYDNAYFSALAFLQKSDKLWVARAISDDCRIGGVVFGDSDGGSNVAISSGSGFTMAGAPGESLPEDYSFGGTDSFLLYAANPGAWINDVEVQLYNYASSPDTVREPYAFLLRIYSGSTLKEEWTCSRRVDHIDGYGRNIFLENVLDGSNYVRGLNNDTLDSDANPYPEEQTTSLPLGGGEDGGTVDDGDLITGLNLLASGSNMLTILMDGGWATPAYQTALDTMAGVTRRDCLAVLSTPYDEEADANYVTAITSYRKTDLIGIDSSYSALFTPHVKIYDRYNDRYLYVSPDGYAAAVMSYTAANYAMWMPPAGPRRGVLNVLGLRREFSQAEMDTLYDAGINPFKYAPGRGIMVWGQKTMLNRPSALDRINVRMLLIEIEPGIQLALDDFEFEVNNASTRAQVKTMIGSYLNDKKAEGGIYDFSVVCDTDNNTPEDLDQHRLNVDIYIKPVMSIEYIQFNMIITRTGASFAVAA